MRNGSIPKRRLRALRHHGHFRSLQNDLLRRRQNNPFRRRDLDVVILSNNLHLPACRNKLGSKRMRKQTDPLQCMQHQFATSR